MIPACSSPMSRPAIWTRARPEHLHPLTRLAAGGKTIIMVIHDEARAARTDRAAVIADGEVVNEHVTHALAALNYDQLAEVQRHVTPTTFQPGQVIIRQGDVGEHFYILTAGRAEVYVDHPDGHDVLVDRLRVGQYFGEMALLGDTRAGPPCEQPKTGQRRWSLWTRRTSGGWWPTPPRCATNCNTS